MHRRAFIDSRKRASGVPHVGARSLPEGEGRELRGRRSGRFDRKIMDRKNEKQLRVIRVFRGSKLSPDPTQIAESPRSNCRKNR